MATLKELQDLMLAIPGVTPDTVGMIISELRRSLPGEKVYIPPPDTSKKQAIIEAAKTLPTGVVAERYGVHPSWARKLARRGVSRRK